MRGSWLHGLEFHDLRLHAERPEGPAVEVAAERLVLRYRPLALLSPGGSAAFVASAAIDIEALNAAVSLPAAPTDGDGGSGSNSWVLPPALPALHVGRAAFLLRNPGLEASFAGGVSLAAADAGEALRALRLTVPSLELRRPSATAGDAGEILRGRLDVAGLLHLPPGRPGEAALRGEVNLEAVEPGGRPVALQARSAFDRRALRIDSLSARGWASRLELREARVPANALFAGEAERLLRDPAVGGSFPPPSPRGFSPFPEPRRMWSRCFPRLPGSISGGACTGGPSRFPGGRSSRRRETSR